MARSVTAKVKPELLAWARTSAKLTEAALAKKIDVDAATISAWERGDGAPTIPKLRQIAEACRRPLLVFYLPAPPTDFTPIRDYRRIDPMLSPSDSSALALEIRRAQERREAALELARLLGEPPALAGLRAEGSDPANAAAQVRTQLEVPVGTQMGWRDSGKALRTWRATLERFGILIFQMSRVAVQDVRAFSIGASPFPVIVVNGADSDNGRVFSLMHELGHVLLGEGGQCRVRREDEGADATGRVEAFCNAFAGELLVPAAALTGHALVRGHSDKQWSDADLEELARTFSVSRVVIARRLLSLGRASQKFYQEVHDKYATVDQAKPKPKKKAGKEGGPDYYRVRVATLGRSYIRLVFSGLAEGRISELDAAGFLGVKTRGFAKLKQEAFHGEATR
ncbi:MAG TPA: XRE family transcriptional regulator [Nannocystaceae bacterium]|nr:XRE family transcriptional regulator [Nannocystaceae bacterium]